MFAFSITLLVVSLEVPHSFDELLASMHGLLGFAMSFTALAIIWHAQHRWFRRYGLQDGISTMLNLVLLFVVLFYVYPLKFLFGLLAAGWTGQLVQATWADGAQGVGMIMHGTLVPALRDNQWPMLMKVYGCGFLAVYSVLLLLEVHAWRLRDELELELDAYERHVAVEQMQEQALALAIGVLSVGIAVLLPSHLAWSGFAYLLLFPVLTLNGVWMRRHAPPLGTPATAAARALAAPPPPPAATPVAPPAPAPASDPPPSGPSPERPGTPPAHRPDPGS